MMPVPDIAMDEFAMRQFSDPNYAGTKISVSKEKFMDEVLKLYEKRKCIQDEFKDAPVLVDGYAPFCKHIFMPNFMEDVRDGAVEIRPDNEHLLRTKYEARREDELPVLMRYFPRDKVNPPESEYLDLIREFVAIAILLFRLRTGLLRHSLCATSLTRPSLDLCSLQP